MIFRYLELEHFLENFFLEYGRAGKRDANCLKREEKNNNNSDKHQTPKRKEKGTKKSMGRAHRFVRRCEKKTQQR